MSPLPERRRPLRPLRRGGQPATKEEKPAKATKKAPTKKATNREEDEGDD